MEKLLSLQEAADMLNINPMTLRRWDDSGKLTAVRLGPRGDRKYRLSDIQKFVDSGRQFVSDTLQDFLNTGLMYYAYQEEREEINYKYRFTLPENPLGYSPSVTQALQNIQTVNLSHYPHVTGNNLAKKISAVHGISAENVLIGAGALDLEILIFTTTVNKGDQVVMPETSFPATEFVALLAGAELSFVKMTNDLDVDLDALAQAINDSTKLVVLSNPNNPTGKKLSKSMVLALIQTKPNTLFVVDEANIELSTSESFLSEALSYKNLIVIRTFSKGYGLAGCRVGYLVAHKDLAYLLKRRQTPFSINSIGLYLAEVALDDSEHIAKSKKFVFFERGRIEGAFQRCGFDYVVSDSIYLLVKMNKEYSSASMFRKFLNEHNIDVVDGTNFRGLGDQYIRICMRDAAANDYLIQTIQTLHRR